MKSFEEGVEQRFTPQEAIQQEKGILGRFEGKAKEIARAFLLATALAVGAGGVEQAFAEEKPPAGEVEKKKTLQERAVDLLNILSNLPDNSAAVNEAHNSAMKSEVARSLIFKFSLEKKLGFPETASGTVRISGRITPDEIRGALRDLGAAGEAFADRFFGNNDGKADEEEIRKLQEATKSNPGLRTLKEMLQQFNP